MTSRVLLTWLFTIMTSTVEPGSSPVRVNEVVAGTAGFVELRNTGNAAVDLGGWEIRSCRSGKSAHLATFPLGAVVPAGSFFLVTGHHFTGTAQRQLVIEAVESSVTVRNSTGARIDGVGFTENSPCREGTPSTQCGPASLGRDARSRDTDDNATDFTCQQTTPDQVND